MMDPAALKVSLVRYNGSAAVRHDGDFSQGALS
jgi:hypothetical protein